MPDARRQFAILYRDFLIRILDLELLASRGEAQRLLAQFAALLAAFSFTFCVYFVPRYGLSNLPWAKLRQMAWVDQDLLIATTMAIAAMFTILAWNNMLPDRRDRVILGLLPMRDRTIFFAKIAALGASLSVAVAALNSFSGLAYPFILAGPDAGLLEIARGFAVFWTTIVLAAIWVCCALLTLQATAALLLTYRAFLKVSSILQMSAFFVVLGVYFLKPPFQPGQRSLPTAWFLGLMQSWNGDPQFAPLAARAIQALCLTVPLAIGLFLLAFHRFQRHIVEQPDIAPSDRSRATGRLLSRLASKLLPHPVERALLLFTARTIARSRHHRLLLAAYSGIGLAIALAYARDLLYGSRDLDRFWRNPKWNQPNAPLLVGSLVLIFFAVIGARAVFAQPIALRSNWIFRITAVKATAHYFAATRRSVLLLIVAPIVVAWAATLLLIWPTAPALQHTAILTVAGFLMVQLSLHRFRKIPFACSYLPGKANIHVRFGIFGIGFLFVTTQAVALEYWALQRPVAYTVILSMLVVYAFWAWRRNRTAPESEILFEDLPPADIEALNLHDRGPRGGKPFVLPAAPVPRSPFSLEQFFQDLRNAPRIVIRNPAFSAAVIALMAIGIGGNATIYSIINAVLTRPAPGVNPDGLLTFGAMRGAEMLDPGEHSYPEYLYLATNSRTIASMTAVIFERFNLTLPDGSSYRLRGNLVTGNYFDTIGVPLALGRPFTVEEARGSGPLAAVITYSVWQTQFQQRADILGQSILLNGFPATIVGVAPPGFHGTSLVPNLEVCVPLIKYSRIRGTEELLANVSANGVGIYGRLAPRASIETAQAEFDTLARQLQGRIDPSSPLKRVVLAPYTATAFGPNSGPRARVFFAIMMGGAMLSLLVVCANVANLMLGRSFSRQREFAVRLSLGAPRSRILRTLLAEALTLSILGAGAAWIFAQWTTRAIVALFPTMESGARFEVDLAPDSRVAVYALLLAVFSAAVFTIAPALRLARQELLPSLKQGEHGIASRSRLASILMVVQVAFCSVLLIGGGLAARSLQWMDATDLGFPRDHLLLVSVASSDPQAIPTVFDRVRDRLRQLHNVEAASWATGAPPNPHPWTQQAETSGASLAVDGTYIGPDYFRTLGVPLLSGRDVDPRAATAVINRKLARTLWPNGDAVGQTFLLGRNTTPLQVVGIVPDAAFSVSTDDGSFAALEPSQRRPFVLLADHPRPGPTVERTFHIRYHGSLQTLAPAVRAAIHDTDHSLTVFGLHSMEEEWNTFTSLLRVLVRLLVFFATGALIVASIGLYAVIAFYTSKRKRELGIRMALGATPAQTSGLILKEGVVLTASGLAIGMAISAIAGKLFSHMLFGVTPADPVTWSGVAALLVIVSLAACWLPARRAAKVDPVLALRQD